MITHIAITALGSDRPGIVASLSKVLYKTDCNIEDSSMTLIGGEFAIIMIVAVGKTSLNTLKSKLNSLGKRIGLTLSIRELSNKEIKRKDTKNNYIFSIYGADKPGIVYKVSDFLAKNKINITDVQTNMSGSGKNATYIMFLETSIPDPDKLDKIKADISKTAKELKIKVSINPVESSQL
ncbi:glycine cleavage system protein R [Elusimicrobiota bacterium]